MSEKNVAAQALAARRWSKVTETERKEIGRKLTAARTAKTPEERAEQARNAAKKRWSKI